MEDSSKTATRPTSPLSGTSDGTQSPGRGTGHLRLIVSLGRSPEPGP